MERKLIIPIGYKKSPEERQAYLHALREEGTKSVFLVVWRKLFFLSGAEREAELSAIRDNIRFYRENGLPCGLWVQAFGFSDPLHPLGVPVTAGMTKIRSVMGVDCKGDAFCPEDPGYLALCASLIRDLAALKPDALMLDDDLCLSVRPGLGCFCDRHLSLLEKEVGEQHTLAAWRDLIFTGRAGRHRAAYMRVMGNTLRAYCRKMRDVAHEIDPTLRVGFCSGFTSWDSEGASATDLAKELAGDLKPFLRLSGAPYWAAADIDRFHGKNLAVAIDFARMLDAFALREGITDRFHELDSYPRDSAVVPPSYVELFDLAALASSDAGRLKYLHNYGLAPLGEDGFHRLHVKEAPLRDTVETLFRDKTPRGVRVYSRPMKLADEDLPIPFAGEESIMETAFSPAAAMLSANGIPAIFDGASDCGIVFGEDARGLSDLPKKLAADRAAARLLAQAGAIPTVNLGETSPFVVKTGKTDLLVLPFDATMMNFRAKELVSHEAAKTLSSFFGESVLSVTPHAPGLYVICAEGNGEAALLLENLSPSPLYDLTLTLPCAARSVRAAGTDATLSGDTLRIASLPPYTAAAIEVGR